MFCELVVVVVGELLVICEYVVGVEDFGVVCDLWFLVVFCDLECCYGCYDFGVVVMCDVEGLDYVCVDELVVFGC